MFENRERTSYDNPQKARLEIPVQNRYLLHMDALSSAVARKVDIDLQLTLMASSLYRILGVEIGRGYEVAKSRHIFRDFIEASATVTIEPDAVQVRFAKRAHNPLLLAVGFNKVDVLVKWWSGKHLRRMNVGSSCGIDRRQNEAPLMGGFYTA